METVLGRYRNLTILVGVLFLQVLGLAVQVKRSADAENTRLIRVWAVDAITPFERVLVWAQNGGNNLWHDYFYLRGVRAENRELKQQIEQMRLEQVRLSEDAEQAHRLQQLLAFKEQVIAKTVPAQVIGSSGSDLSRSIYIDKGSKDGIATDMAVITSGGIVGKVLRVYPSTSLVLVINDQTSGVGVMLEKSRLQGVLKGTPDGAVVLERVMNDEQVSPGETVVSSGGDQIFPKGLPVGTVAKVSPGHEMFLKIQVKPAADLSRLEEVLVVTEKQEKNAVVDTGVRVRAADILAQRLPSVPDKPAVTASAANAVGSAQAAPTGQSNNNVASKPQAPVPGPAKPNSVSPLAPGANAARVPANPSGPNSSTAVRAAGSGTQLQTSPAAANATPAKQVVKKPAPQTATPAITDDTATNTSPNPPATKTAGSNSAISIVDDSPPNPPAVKPAAPAPQNIQPTLPPPDEKPN